MHPSSLQKTLLLSLCLLGFAASTVRADDAVNILSPADGIAALKLTTKGKPNVLAGTGDFGGLEGNDEPVSAVIDGDTNTKHLNKAKDGSNAPGVNTGFVVTPKAGPTVVTAVQLATANDVPERDPVKITVEGSNDPKALETGSGGFKLLYEGTCGLDNTTDRGATGEVVKIDNHTPYLTYRVLVTAVRGGSSEAESAVQYAEVKLLGKPASAKPASVKPTPTNGKK